MFCLFREIFESLNFFLDILVVQTENLSLRFDSLYFHRVDRVISQTRPSPPSFNRSTHSLVSGVGTRVAPSRLRIGRVILDSANFLNHVFNEKVNNKIIR